MSGDAFYAHDGERFVPTEWTRGPWDAGAQHAGPPAALVARAIERLDPRAEMRVARFTFEILRPIPIAPLIVDASAVRTGKRVQFSQASLRTADGDEVARAAAWRIRPAPDPVVDLEPEPGPTAGPGALETTPILEFGPLSYFTAMEWRFARGTFREPGPATCWMRMRVPLVAGEEPSPLARVLCAADSGNGISSLFRASEFLFINTELSVHLVRMPEGEWVCMDSVTHLDAHGVGLAETVLSDERGRIGRGSQALLVAPRG